MRIISKSINAIQEAYKTMKKSFNIFLKKLGFNKTDISKASNSFDKQLKIVVSEYDKEHKNLKELLDKIIPENEPVKSLHNEILDSLSPETASFLSPNNETKEKIINSLLNGLYTSLLNEWDEFGQGTLSLLKQYVYIPEDLEQSEIIPYFEEMGYILSNKNLNKEQEIKNIKEKNHSITIPSGTYVIDASKILEIDPLGEVEPVGRFKENTNWILSIDKANYLGEKIEDDFFLGNVPINVEKKILENNNKISKDLYFNELVGLLSTKIDNQKIDMFINKFEEQKNKLKNEPVKSLHNEILDSLSPETASFLSPNNETTSNSIPSGTYVIDASKIVQFIPSIKKQSEILNKNLLLVLSIDKAIYTGNKNVKNVLDDTMSIAKNKNITKNNIFQKDVFFSNIANTLGITINPIPKPPRVKKYREEDLLKIREEINKTEQIQKNENERE